MRAVCAAAAVTLLAVSGCTTARDRLGPAGQDEKPADGWECEDQSTEPLGCERRISGQGDEASNQKGQHHAFAVPTVDREVAFSAGQEQ